MRDVPFSGFSGIAAGQRPEVQSKDVLGEVPGEDARLLGGHLDSRLDPGGAPHGLLLAQDSSFFLGRL
jgi:hypothetical protein